jgi:hypothetical protein
VNDPATSEAAAPLIDRRPTYDGPRNTPAPRVNSAAIEERLAAIEAVASKWLGGRHTLITRHVDALRKLL